MRRFLPALLVLVVLGFFAAWWFSDGQVVRRQVKGLVDSARVPSGMSDLGRGARGPKVAGYFAEQLRLEPLTRVRELPDGDYPRDRLAALYSGAARFAKSISFENLAIEDVQVTGDVAEVNLRVDGIVQLPSSRPLDGIQRAAMRWRKIEGDWLLESVQWREEAR